MKPAGKMLLVANWESNVGYAWWLMENYWATIAEHLQKKGVKSILIFPKVTQISPVIDKTDIDIIEHDFRDITFKGLARLRALIKHQSIQYIYLTDCPAYSWLYLLVRLWGVKTIIIHDHTPGERTRKTGIKRILKSIIQRIPFFTADHFIAVTQFVYKRFLEVECIPDTKCSCAPNGIEPIDIQSSDLDYAQEIFNIPKDRFIVVATGRATYYKGIDFFIKCANELINVRDNKQFHFLFCGDGPDLADFRNMVKNYTLETYFTFAGKRTDVRKILPSCTIGFHPSLGEVGYSLSILEFMSAGLITIVPDNPSTALAIINNQTGFTYKYNDIESVVSIMIHSVKSDNSSNIGCNAADYIRREKDISNTNKILVDIIDHVIFDKHGGTAA